MHRPIPLREQCAPTTLAEDLGATPLRYALVSPGGVALGSAGLDPAVTAALVQSGTTLAPVVVSTVNARAERIEARRRRARRHVPFTLRRSEGVDEEDEKPSRLRTLAWTAVAVLGGILVGAQVASAKKGG